MDYIGSDLLDCMKVASVNTLAITLSYSGLENSLRMAGLIVAFLYTTLKVIFLLKNWNKKDDNE